MSSSTVNSKKFSSSNNGLKQCKSMYPRNSVQLSSSNFEDSILQSQSWSDRKVKNEISSFIAEYSYLADTKEEKSYQQNGPTVSLQTYQVYPAEYFKENLSTGLNYNKALIKPKRKKSIVWKDKKSPSLKHNEDHLKSHLLRRQSDERKIHYLPSTNNKLIEDDKHENIKQRPGRNQRSRSRSKRRLSHQRKKHIPRFLLRNRSTSQSIKNPLRKRKHKPREPSYNKSKTRMAVRSTKYPYNRSKRKMRPQPTESHIKYIPLRYERKKSRKRRIVRPQRVLKTPQMSPSVVTLYPSNIIQEEVLLPYNQYLVDSHISCNCNRCQKTNEKKQSKRYRNPAIRDLTPITSPSTITLYPNNPLIREIIIPYDAEIFEESHKSCKCHECMKKLKSVIKMCQKKQRLKKPKLKSHFDLVKCEDLCFGKEVGLCELNMCMNQAEIEYESSINFKFNSYCQYFDPKIAGYFYSILDQASYV